MNISFGFLRLCNISGVFFNLSGGVGINHLSAGKLESMAIPLVAIFESEKILAINQKLSLMETRPNHHHLLATSRSPAPVHPEKSLLRPTGAARPARRTRLGTAGAHQGRKIRTNQRQESTHMNAPHPSFPRSGVSAPPCATTAWAMAITWSSSPI